MCTPSGDTHDPWVFGATDVLATLTETLEVTEFPAPSTALAMTVWVPFVTPLVFHCHDQDEVPDAACHAPPSTWTATLATPTLSELVPLTATVPASVAPLVGDLNATVGGVVSVTLLSTLADTLPVVTLPELSVARAVMVWVPLATVVVFHDQDQDVVPVAGCQAPPSTCTATLATDTLSLAVPETETVPPTVAPAAGDVIEIAGATASPLLIETDSIEVDVLPSESVALASSV
jgi:hypothetical protein